MAVAIVNQDVTHANGNSFTAGAGSNRLLVFAGASVDTNQMPVTGAGTFGGTTLAEAVEIPWDGGVRKGIVRGYYLPEASIPATAQVSAFTGDTTLETPYEGSVLTLSGVDQTTPIPATGVATITLDDVADTLNFAAPAGIAFLVSQHLGSAMGDPVGWTLLSTYAPMTNGTQLKTWQRAFATADPAASVTLTGGGAQDGRAAVFCVAAAAGGQTIPVGQVTETDLAQAVGVAKSKTIGLAAETDSAFGVSSVTAIPVGLATENDSAFAVATAKSKAVGLVLEADSAFEVTANRAHAVGLATESDSALAVTRTSGIPVGQAVENDSVFAVSAAKSRSAGLATESDSAFAVTADRAHQVGLAVENDSAFDIGHFRVKEIGLATETDQAFAVIGGAVPIRKRAKYMLLNIGRMLH